MSLFSRWSTDVAAEDDFCNSAHTDTAYLPDFRSFLALIRLVVWLYGLLILVPRSVSQASLAAFFSERAN